MSYEFSSVRQSVRPFVCYQCITVLQQTACYLFVQSFLYYFWNFTLSLCSSCTMSMLLFSRVAFLSRFNFFVLHYFLVALFSCSTSFSLHSFYVALFRIALLSCFAISFSFHVFFVLYFFHVARTLFMSCYFQVALFCTLYFGLFSFCTIFMLLLSFVMHYVHAALIFRVALFSF